MKQITNAMITSIIPITIKMIAKVLNDPVLFAVGGGLRRGLGGDLGSIGLTGEVLAEHGLKGGSHKPLLPTFYKTQNMHSFHVKKYNF